MERESRGRGENFVNKKRLNLVARSAAAISIAAAGAVAVEKFGSFDPLESSVDSANHLVLNNLHKSYEQLIDKLPEVEKAEAAAVSATCTAIAASTWNCNHPVATNDHIAIKTPTGLFLVTEHTCHANVFVPPDSETEIGAFEVTILDDPDNVNCNTFGAPPVSNQPICCALKAPSTKGVGGIAERPDVQALPQNMNSEKSRDYTIPIEAGVAAAAAALTTAAALLYSRRKRSS